MITTPQETEDHLADGMKNREIPTTDATEDRTETMITEMLEETKMDGAKRADLLELGEQLPP